MARKRGSRTHRRQQQQQARKKQKPEATSLEVYLWKDAAASTTATTPSVTEIPPPLTLQQLQDKDDNDETDTADNNDLFLLKSKWNQLSRSKQWKAPTQIQLQAWSILLLTSSSSLNLIQISPTGSGKTLGYGLPLLVKYGNALVLVPTRELALQVQSQLTETIFDDTNSTAAAVIACHGGVDKEQQRRALQQQARKKNVIVTATPGRLLDLLSSSSSSNDGGEAGLPFSKVETVVLDEADRLAVHTDLSRQVSEILQHLECRRMVLCSATWPDKATETWRGWMTKYASSAVATAVVKVDAITMSVVPQQPDQQQRNSNAANDTGDCHSQTVAATSNYSGQFSSIPAHLTQTLHVCAEHKKPKKLLTTLRNIIQTTQQQRLTAATTTVQLGIIFCSKIKKVRYVQHFLSTQQQQPKIACAALHGELRQRDREHVLRQFQSGRTPWLVATDLCARGIHVANVSTIINYDFPGNLEQYIHRCGRAGRGGSATTTAKATVYSFFTRNFKPMAADLVALLECSNQWVDPNLRLLVQEQEAGVPAKKQSSSGTRASSSPKSAANTGRSGVDPSAASSLLAADAREDSDDDDNEEEDYDFKQLSGKRIVLKRALNVSDASEDSSSEEDND